MEKGKKKKKIIVNALTASRIAGALCLPFIINTMSIPAIITLLSGLFITDFLDGKLARKWKVQTVGGSLLDPLSDKVLALSCILSLLGTQSFLIFPLFMELGITGININRALHEENVKSTIPGKLKTWILSITLVLGAINLLNPEIINQIVSFIGLSNVLPNLTVTDELVKSALIVTGTAEAITMGDYIKESAKQWKTRNDKIAELKSAKECLIRLFDETKYEEDKNKPIVKVLKKNS